jgi:hypothetical protein
MGGGSSKKKRNEYMSSEQRVVAILGVQVEPQTPFPAAACYYCGHADVLITTHSLTIDLTFYACFFMHHMCPHAHPFTFLPDFLSSPVAISRALMLSFLIFIFVFNTGRRQKYRNEAGTPRHPTLKPNNAS